jgi:ABC-type dipeptide/oligopeptide/nickel transport system permease subunit
MSLFPAGAITSLVVGFSLLADGIREISIRD